MSLNCLFRNNNKILSVILYCPNFLGINYESVKGMLCMKQWDRECWKVWDDSIYKKWLYEMNDSIEKCLLVSNG